MSFPKFTETQVRILLYMPSALCLISIGGSCWIVSEVVKRVRRKGRQALRTYHRLILAMSIVNILSSLSFALGNVPVPSENARAIDSYGNQTSCNFQGFLIVLSFIVPGYNSAMAINFLLIIRYRKSDRWVSRYVEPWLHGLVITPPLITAICCLHLEAFNFSGSRCFVAPKPQACMRVKTIPCVRGASAKVMLYSIFGTLTIILFAILFCSMASILYGVYETEEKSVHWHCHIRSESVFDAKEKQRRRKVLSSNYRSYRLMKRSREATRQAILHVTAFLLSYMWSYIVPFYTETNRPVPFTLAFLFSFFYPLHGFFNFIIFQCSSRKKKPASTHALSAEPNRIIRQQQYQTHDRQRKKTIIKKFGNPNEGREIETTTTSRVSLSNELTLSPEQPQSPAKSIAVPPFETSYCALMADAKNNFSTNQRFSEPSNLNLFTNSSPPRQRISIKGSQMLAMVAASAALDDEDDFINEIDNQYIDTMEQNGIPSIYTYND